MDVRGDRVRGGACRDRHFRDRVVEASASVTDIEDDAPLLGGKCSWQQLSVLHNVGELSSNVWEPCIAVRQYISRAQQVEDICHELRRFDPTDVAHDLCAAACLFAGLDGTFQGFCAVLGDHVLRHAYLNADGDV